MSSVARGCDHVEHRRNNMPEPEWPIGQRVKVKVARSMSRK